MHYLSRIGIEHLSMKLILVDKVVLLQGQVQQQSIHMIILKYTRCQGKMLRLLSSPCVYHLQCNMEHRISFNIRFTIITIFVRHLVKEHVAKWIGHWTQGQKIWGLIPSVGHM